MAKRIAKKNPAVRKAATSAAKKKVAKVKKKAAKKAKDNKIKMKKGGQPKYSSEYNEITEKMCMLGYTDAELADLFEVNESTINAWKKRYKTFARALKKGKSLCDGEVVNQLYLNATESNNVTAQIFWLKNRRNQQWRDKHEFNVDTSDSLTELLQAISDSNLVGPEHLREF